MENKRQAMPVIHLCSEILPTYRYIHNITVVCVVGKTGRTPA